MEGGYAYSASAKGRCVVDSGDTVYRSARSRVLLALSIECDPGRTQARTDAHLALSRSDYASARRHAALPCASTEHIHSIFTLAGVWLQTIDIELEDTYMGRYPEDGEKVCPACGQKKAFAAFYQRQNLTDGRMDVCIVCFQAECPTKVCNTCHTTKPLDSFPVHPSSADGHKYTCSACLEQQKIRVQADRTQYSIDERRRKADWANQRAEQTPRYGHPSALWARDICALPNAVVLDTETTGFGSEAEIIDLGIISIDGKKLVNQLIQCEAPQIPADATRVHGITKEMLDREHAPTFPQIWKKLMERLETYVILIYNADFDRQMLEQTAERYKLPMPKLDIRCMMKPVADYIGGGRKAYKLEVACQYFHVENTNAHRAFADAQASQRVLQAMAQMAVAPELRALPAPTNLSSAHSDKIGVERVKSTGRSTLEDRRAEFERQNLLLRTYGYRWKSTESLNREQYDVLCNMLLDSYERQEPAWTLLSPLDMPVDKDVILQWLNKCGPTQEEMLAFLDNHGFVALGKDIQQRWRIQTPSGNVVNLKQALQEVEHIRIDRANARAREREQERKEEFEQSVQTLKEALNLHGEAMNDCAAWGYSPQPIAKRLSDGTIEVTTYHFESEWHTATFQDESQVVSHLYSDSEGYWDPGVWSEPH